MSGLVPGLLTGYPSGHVNAISADGHTAVGSVEPVTNGFIACYWTSVSGNWTDPVGPTIIGTMQSSAYGVSADGSMIFGDFGSGFPASVYKWTTATGLVGFDTDSTVNGASADGNCVIGAYRSLLPPDGTYLPMSPCFWNSVGVRTDLTLPSGFVAGKANSTNRDGSMIVGAMYPTADVFPGLETGHPFVWTAATGVIDLGFGGFPGAAQGQANGVSDNGTVVGWVNPPTGGGGNSASFTWTQSGGMVTYPYDVQFGYAAISGDGRTIFTFAFWPNSSLDFGTHVGYVKDGELIVPTPIGGDEHSFYNPSAISADGMIMAGYLGGTVAPNTIPYVYVVPIPATVSAVDSPKANPHWRLSVSDDGSRTWSPLVKPREIGGTGEYTKRLRWLKMGQFRQRSIKLECTDPVRRNIIGIYIDNKEGMK